jgi:hypothetical protein
LRRTIRARGFGHEGKRVHPVDDAIRSPMHVHTDPGNAPGIAHRLKPEPLELDASGLLHPLSQAEQERVRSARAVGGKPRHAAPAALLDRQRGLDALPTRPLGDQLEPRDFERRTATDGGTPIASAPDLTRLE